jgi:hypothetical protein
MYPDFQQRKGPWFTCDEWMNAAPLISQAEIAACLSPTSVIFTSFLALLGPKGSALLPVVLPSDSSPFYFRKPGFGSQKPLEYIILYYYNGLN